MKYKVLLAPLQITHNTKAQEGDIAELTEADADYLVRCGIVAQVEEAKSKSKTKTAPTDTEPEDGIRD